MGRYKAAEALMLKAAAADADIIIATALIPGRPAPKLITADAVHAMRAGGVTVDLAAETGGNIATTVSFISSLGARPNPRLGQHHRDTNYLRR